MAKWVETHRIWDWLTPGGRSMRCFQPGLHYMTDAQADEVVRVGAGVVVERPDGGKVTKGGKIANRSQP